MNLVVDASVAFKWLVKENESDLALRILADEDLVAPDLLQAECRNAILTSVRRGKMSVDAALQIERQFEVLDISILPSHPFLQNGFAIALELQHPIYDCMYLAVAIATDRTLVTADERFLAKLAGSRFGRDRVKRLADLAAQP